MAVSASVGSRLAHGTTLKAGPSAPHPRRGEIWMVFTPGQPDDPHQPRPALVVSDDVRNRMRDDLIVVPAFSAGRIGPSRVAIAAGEGGLRNASVLFCEEVTTIDRDFLRRGPLGRRLTANRMAAVVRAIRRAVGDVIPEPASA